MRRSTNSMENPNLKVKVFDFLLKKKWVKICGTEEVDVVKIKMAPTDLNISTEKLAFLTS